MDEKELHAMADLAEQLPDQKELHSNTMLAGNIMAQPMVRMRKGQSRFEMLRTKARFSKKSKAYQRHVLNYEKANGLESEMQSEISRLKVEQPEAGSDKIAVYGYVRDGKKPVPGATVALFSDKGRAAFIETADDGSYKLSVDGDTPHGLEVLRKDTLLMRDSKCLLRPAPVAIYRNVDLSVTQKPRPEQKKPGKEITDDRDNDHDTGPVKPDTEEKPVKPKLIADLKGQTLHQGYAVLAERQIEIASVILTDGNDLTPRITGAKAAGERSVALHVSVKQGDEGDMKALSVLLSNDADSQGTAFASSASAMKWFAENKVKNAGLARKISRSDPELFRKVAKMEDTAKAKKLQAMLRSSVAKIKREE